MSSLPDVMTLRRAELRRAVGRLPSFDLVVLLTIALLADPVTGNFTATWDGLAEHVGVPRSHLPPVLQRLADRGLVVGRVDAPEGLHVHLDGLLVLPPALPPNLPLDQTL